MTSNAITDFPRVDARDKVTGAPIYAADRVLPGMLHGAFAVSTITKGRLEKLDLAAASAVPGVRLIITHETVKDKMKRVGFLLAGSYAFQSFQPMLSDAIAYRGQPVALIVAETLDAAVHAASLVEGVYQAEPFSPCLGSEGAVVIPQAQSPLPQQLFGDITVGDAQGAWDEALTTTDLTFHSPPQHQNPMELVATVATWDDDHLTIYEGTQNSGSLRHGVAEILGLDPSQVTVISPQVGGGFGQKNSLQMQTAFAALVARETGAPVKIVVPRRQLFLDASFRPESSHRVRLGADSTGRVTSAIYEIDAQTSRHDLFPLDYTSSGARLFGIPNFQGRQRLVQTDVQTPGYMRAPYEHFSSFAIDSSIDDMAHKLGRDPVEYRLAHDIATDYVTGRPHSSRYLSACLERGASLFGWSRRKSAPGSMIADNGDLMGWGVGVGCYKAATAAAIARLQVSVDGGVMLTVGVHEMGQGIRSALTRIVAEKLSVPMESIVVVIGDTRGAPQHLTAGSWGTATAVPAAASAADKMMEALSALNAGGINSSPAEILKAAGRTDLSVEIERPAPGLPKETLANLMRGSVSVRGPVYDAFVSYSHIAHFVEVRIEHSTRRIRVPRVVSVADCGRVISPRTAASQVRGGVVWGIGASLRESSEVDIRYGGFLNTDIAEYVIPVNADIGSIEVDFVNEPDPQLNESGVKSLGEVAMTGVASAIANAVFHATGQRIRDLPIRIEHTL
ncbi:MULTISPECIES: xanthine dehydrogenase family protein molybdopterin-binding subunit [unclassified Sinorhizobium]|uniref:xanthine dehydrogenase family protein molybdopterin-binding subunit n=1 Tax=unclassified Sinorhizobium TaxID=2613772 RepID=UPI00352497B5